MAASLKPKTARLYDGYVARFRTFLYNQDIAEEDATTKDVLEFLTPFASDAFAATYVRGMKSALVKYLKDNYGGFYEDENLIKRFLRGAQHLCRRPTSKEFVWDAHQVVDYVARQEIPTTIREAAKDAITLLALTTGARADDLHKLGADVRVVGNSLMIPFLESPKTRKKNGDLRTDITVKLFPGKKRICPGEAVRRYLEISAMEDRSPFLFVSATDGHRVAIATMRKWLSEVLTAAEIQGPPGSTRSASSSAAWADGKSFDQIAAMTGWLRESTFTKHYRKRIVRLGENLLEGQFGE